MPLIPVDHLLANAVFQTPSAGGPANVVTGHVAPTGVSTAEMARILAEDVWGATGSLTDRMDSSYSLRQMVVYRNLGGGQTGVGVWNGDIAGGQPGPAAPPQVAVLIQKESGLAGRRNRGRMYVPGVVQSNVGEDGLLTSGAVSAWLGAVNTFIAAYQAAGIDMVILHETPPDTATSISQLTVQQLVATQRRRLR